MSLTLQLDRYLRVRRNLGHNLGTCERILRRFTCFADSNGATHISTALFLRWHATLTDGSPQTRATRLTVVRLFAQWLSAFDAMHEVPPRGLMPGAIRRPRPHIYTVAEIGMIVAVAKGLPSIYGLRGLTCSTLFGLIAVTGLRINEALALDRNDLDTVSGVLRVREGKLGKERSLPLDPSVVAQLIEYLAKRDRLVGYRVEPLFVTDKTTRLTDCSARYNFARVSQQIGLRSHQPYCKHGRGPRIHDLRHSFAVRTMINWYRTGKDPAREMIRLTSYLGHSNPAHTYWYLEAVPALLDLAMKRATANSREAR